MEPLASCPFCDAHLAPSELERHANDHFEDSRNLINESHKVLHISQEDNLHIEISNLISHQMKSPFHRVDEKGGIMSLLLKSLQDEASRGPKFLTRTTFLCGEVDHFCCLESQDMGWGCGWRNIQMLSSHLLFTREAARATLFGGCGFVPDIPYLQRWLEFAWEMGFDTAGSLHFNKSIYGSEHLIGTTECAALFRSFGFRAKIVDFSVPELELSLLSVPGTIRCKRNFAAVYGPMDRFVHRESSSNTKNNKAQKCHALLEWVWNYFSEDHLKQIDSNSQVIKTAKSPLYFQHDGHSRTIVGIQMKQRMAMGREFDLLILDPGHKTGLIENSLVGNGGWEKLLKRGVHTLKKPQYQLCYIDKGMADDREMEKLKTMNSVLVEL